jgi:hypothetical protein
MARGAEGVVETPSWDVVRDAFRVDGYCQYERCRCGGTNG